LRARGTHRARFATAKRARVDLVQSSGNFLARWVLNPQEYTMLLRTLISLALIALPLTVSFAMQNSSGVNGSTSLSILLSNGFNCQRDSDHSFICTRAGQPTYHCDEDSGDCIQLNSTKKKPIINHAPITKGTSQIKKN
jgi:hypothetical protein